MNFCCLKAFYKYFTLNMHTNCENACFFLRLNVLMIKRSFEATYTLIATSSHCSAFETIK